MIANFITVNDEEIEFDPGLYAGKQIREIASIPPSQTLMLDNDGEVDVPIYDDDYIVICGGETFVVDESPTVPDTPCYRKPIGIELNGTVFEGQNGLSKAKVTGADLKQLDEGIDKGDKVYIDIPSAPDELLEDCQTLVVHKSLSFLTVPCGNVGEAFASPILIEQFSKVHQLYPTASLEHTGKEHLLIIDQFPLPTHWSVQSVELLIIVPNGYPSSPLDMFYVSPSISLTDGRVPDSAKECVEFKGKKWQRFSWHYKSRPWNPSVDNLLSHLSFCKTRLTMSE